jgi:hypothetical protein
MDIAHPMNWCAWCAVSANCEQQVLKDRVTTVLDSVRVRGLCSVGHCVQKLWGGSGGLAKCVLLVVCDDQKWI